MQPIAKVDDDVLQLNGGKSPLVIYRTTGRIEESSYSAGGFNLPAQEWSLSGYCKKQMWDYFKSKKF
jgi:hypothetical protein